ncbi:MAG: porin, partial [Burkholderiales bacterium]
PGTSARSYMLGAAVPLGAFELLTSYQWRDGKAGVATAANRTPIGGTAVPVGTVVEADRQVLSLAATYALSKRTNFYASLADATGKKSASTIAGVNTRQYTVGLRHQF